MGQDLEKVNPRRWKQKQAVQSALGYGFGPLSCIFFSVVPCPVLELRSKNN
jgi:hypothetical protein